MSTKLPSTISTSYDLENEAATERLAQQLAGQIKAGDVIFLMGDLGAGKTTFTRYFARALGVTGRIKSPTYALIESYELRMQASTASHLASPQWLHHFDLYRLADPREWFSAGFDEYLNDQSVVLIEWPQMAEGALPNPRMILKLAHAPSNLDTHLEGHDDELAMDQPRTAELIVFNPQ